MNEHRRQILEMLSQGKITADEAERLIAALDKTAPVDSTGAGSASSAARYKYLRILVDSNNGDNNPYQGPVKVNIRVPMKLLRAGVRLAGLIPAQAREHVNEALRQKGIPFNIDQIKPDNLEDLVDQLNELTIDVDVNNKSGYGDEKVKVRVFCE